MIIQVLLPLLGFLLLLVGAEKLVDAASSLASSFGVRPLTIGLTVVAFGTSSPELAINVFAAMEGSSEIALGNVLGSNIFNTLAILGFCAILSPVLIRGSTTWVEVPMGLLAGMAVWVSASDSLLDQHVEDKIGRGDGLFFLLFFAVFLAYVIIAARTSGEKADDMEVPSFSKGKAVVWIVLGLLGLVVGGKLIVDGAVSLARVFGLSERIIALTVVAIGTSLPEMATSLIAVRKNRTDLALGNVVGSNIFNVLFILGISALINPVHVTSASYVDIYANILVSLLLFVFVFTGKGRMLDRREGVVFIVLYVAYLAFLVWTESR